MTLSWLRRLAACFRRLTRADLLQQDLDDCWADLREATKNREHWQGVERMLKARQDRLQRELRAFQKGQEQ